MSVRRALVLGLVLLLPGCSAPALDPSAVATLPPLAEYNDGDPVTEKEALAFAAELERAADTADAPGLAALFDWDALLERATAGLPVAPALRRGFVADSRAGAGRLAEDVCRQVEAGGGYQLLRVHAVDGEWRARFRLVLPGGGVNYHDLLLARRPIGVRAVDADVMASGETLAQGARRLFAPLVADARRSALSRLVSPPTGLELVRAANQLQQMTDRVREGQHRQALDLERALPDVVRRDKVVLLLRLKAARGLEDEEGYRAAMADFRAWHPDDPALDLVCLDYQILTGAHDDALAALDRLDQAVGGDPYLLVLRTGVLLEAGRLPAARAAAKKAVELVPDRPDGYWALVAVHLRERRFGEAVTVLEALQRDHGADVEALMLQPEYSEFFRSPEYVAWAEAQKKAMKR